MLEFLKKCIAKKAGVSAELMLAQMVAQHEGIAAAQTLLTQQLIKNPTMKGFYRLIDYHIAEAEEGSGERQFNNVTGNGWCSNEGQAALPMSTMWFCYSFDLLALSIM